MSVPANAQQAALPECPAFRRFFKWNDCIGSSTLPSGEKYEGEFKNDKPNGKGSSTLPDGTKYSGSWKDGQHHGVGQLIFSNGGKYIGEFSYGAQNGKGTSTWPNGEKYVGSVINGRRDGIGTFTWPDGRKYTGRFNSDQRHGQGTLTWPNGNKYVGDFRFSSLNGEGVLYGRNGAVIQKGEWKDDKFCGAEKCFTMSLLTPAERIKMEIAEIQRLLEKGLITHAEGWRRNQKTYAKYNWGTSLPDQEFFAVAIEAGSRLDKGTISKERYDVEIQRAFTRKQIQQTQISDAENARAAAQIRADQDRVNAELLRQQNEIAKRESAIRALGVAADMLRPTVVTPPPKTAPDFSGTHTYNINGKMITCSTLGGITNCN